MVLSDRLEEALLLPHDKTNLVRFAQTHSKYGSKQERGIYTCAAMFYIVLNTVHSHLSPLLANMLACDRHQRPEGNVLNKAKYKRTGNRQHYADDFKLSGIRTNRLCSRLTSFLHNQLLAKLDYLYTAEEIVTDNSWTKAIDIPHWDHESTGHRRKTCIHVCPLSSQQCV